MVSRTTSSTNSRRRTARLRAFTLVELVVASGVASLVVVVVASLTLFSSQHFAFLADQVTVQAKSIQMTDQFAKDARAARAVVTARPNLLILDQGGNGLVTYAYLAPAKTITRQAGLNTRTMLTDVEEVKFEGFQRTPKKGAFEPYGTGTTNEIKVVYCTWKSKRTKPGSTEKTERQCQTAKAVLRTP